MRPGRLLALHFGCDALIRLKKSLAIQFEATHSSTRQKFDPPAKCRNAEGEQPALAFRVPNNMEIPPNPR